MGNNPSITNQQKQELWNRDINHLFTTAKIIPVQPYSTNFVHSITTKGDENENRLICLLCSDGKIRGVLHSTNSPSIPSSLIFSIVVESQNIFPQDQNTPPDSYFFASTIKLSENYIVITINNGNIFLVSARQKTLFDSNTESNKKDLFEFVFTSFSLPINQKNNDDNQGSLINFSPCIIKYTNDSFIAINHEMTAALCKPDGTIQIIWDGSQLQTNKLPIKPSNDIDTNSTNTKNSRKQYFHSCSSFCCASVYENYLFAIHFSHDETWKGLTYGIVKEKITPLQTFDESLKSIIAMEPYESGIFCLCDTNSGNNRDKNDDENGRFSVISIDIDKNQIIKSSILNFKELNQNNNFVIDFKVIDNKKTLLCMTENSIITYTSDIENHISQDSVNIAGNLEFAHYASLSSQFVFNVVASCNLSQPNLYIMRFTRKSKKTQIELFPMNVRIHEGTIVDSCPVDDFSFITIDDKGKIVLWQSLPEWWDVPYFQKIFDDQQ